MQTTGTRSRRPSGMLGFTVVWAGQLISILASNMTGFGLVIWMYQETESATAMGALDVSFLVPFMLITPFAGAMVDRYNRRLMMMVSDMTAATATVGILALQATGQLQFWHLYVSAVLLGLGNAFQWPAYSAAISTMVPKEQYGRANGMMFLVESGPSVFSPVLAGALLPVIGLTGILLIDVLTFLLAIGALLVVQIPQPQKTVEGQAGKGNLVQEAAFGFRYIFARPSLRGLLLLILSLNLAIGLAGSLYAPMILARTGNDSTSLAGAQTAAAAGGVAGGLLMSAWGGFKRRRIRGMLLGWTVFALVGMIFFGMGRSLAAWIPVQFVASMTFPLSQGSSDAIWQAKVAPDVQGRVFASRRFIAWFVDPIMPIVAGTLADYVTEPAMRAQTGLSDAFGWLVGTGPGAGMGLQYVVAGVGYLLIIGAALMMPVVRDVEERLPDHDQLALAEVAAP